MKRILMLCGLLFVALGVYTGATALVGSEESNIEGASAIAVLSSGEIVVAVSHDQRVLLYSPEGRLLQAVSVDSGWGGIRLRALPDGGFQAATVRNRRLYTFDSDGQIASLQENFDGYESFGPHGQWEARSATGDVYTLEGSTIVRKRGTSKEVVVDQRWRWPLGGEPFVAALLWVSGVAQLLIAFLGAERFRAFILRSAHAKQPQWVGPTQNEDHNPDRRPSATKASSRIE